MDIETWIKATPLKRKSDKAEELSKPGEKFLLRPTAVKTLKISIF